jgi:serine/threonine-protein kinase
MYEERPFLVMELLEGESLYDLMTRERRLDAQTTLRIATQTTRGLAKAHEVKVIHRDLKPENIFLTQSEEGESIAKILDFGLAKFYEPTGGDARQVRLTREGALFGTPAYMSPEQAKGQGEVDHRADLWALGCIVYECLTGQTVWNVDQGVAMILAQIANSPLPRPSRLRPDLPRTFDAWFNKALDRDPSQRFQTAQEFADTLSEALAPLESRARSVPSMHTPEEIPGVDAPMGDAGTPTSQPRLEEGSPGDGVQLAGRTPMRASAELALSARGSVWRAIFALFVVGLLALGGYALWLYVLNAPVTAGSMIPEPLASSAPVPSVAPVTAGQPLEREPYALNINQAQQSLSSGQPEQALKGFREAFANGATGVARTLLAQATALLEHGDGSCKPTGLGRPRPFDLVAPSSQPALTYTEFGPILAWVDNHLETNKRQGFSVLVDRALRRISMTRGVTPEAEGARALDLLAAGPRLVLLYADRAERNESEPGVYVRVLDRDGRIAGKARRISRKLGSYQLNPAMARAEDGTLWVVWEDELAKGSRDLVARHLDADLKPLGREIRLTAWRPTPGIPTVADTPAVALAQGHLLVVFALERAGLANQRQIMLLRVPLNDKQIEAGLAESADVKKGDRYLGRLQALNDQRGKLASPRITCSPEGCFAVWDDEGGGAFAAYVDASKGEKLWHRQFGRGTRPGLGTAASGTVVVWYEDRRVKLATITRDGLGTATTVGRVNGIQPSPAIAAGQRPGEWYVAWRDYEAGHLESFLARLECR